jgi:hypothetical protein
MNRNKFLVMALVAALLLSNAFWLYNAMDTAVTLEYQGVALKEHHEALAQALAVVPVLSRPNSTKADVLAAATRAAMSRDSYEKDGFTWVGSLGLKFGGEGRLEAVVPSWYPF